MKVVKPTVPIEVQGALNRLMSEAAFKTDMTSKNNVAKGGYFILHDVCYQAIRAIPKGTEVVPGVNCIQKDINEMIGGN